MKIFGTRQTRRFDSNPTRRDMLAGGAALGVGAMASGLLLPSKARADPRRGGHAVFAIGRANTTDSFDPQITLTTFGAVTRVTVFDSLYEISTNGEIVPSLATGAEVDATATTWRVGIKTGVTFHNGQTLTPEDVVNSITIHMGEDSRSPMKSLLTNVRNISTDGNDVVFELNTPDVDWPATLAEYTLSIFPTQDGEADWRSGVGTGPYRLLEFEPGVRARFERNENDHRSDRGWFDTIEFAAVNDSSARINAIISGEVHAIAEVEPLLAQRLGSRDGINLVSRTSPGYNVFQMQTTMDSFGNADVRRALKYAIDREEFVERILYGHGTVANDHPIAPTYRFHDASIEQYTYDPDRARYYLNQAGLDSLDVPLHVSEAAFSGSVNAAQLYAESTRSAGINLTPVREPTDGYWSNAWGTTPFFASYWTGRPTEAHLLSLAYGTGAAWNATGYANERLDRIVTEARGQQDEALRAELYSEAQRILHDDGPSVIPAFNNMIDAVSDQIGMPDGNVTQASLDGRYGPSRWWFV